LASVRVAEWQTR